MHVGFHSGSNVAVTGDQQIDYFKIDPLIDCKCCHCLPLCRVKQPIARDETALFIDTYDIVFTHVTG